MDLDFIPDHNSLYIPKEAYRPVKRCLTCHSVYLNETHCEACGRAIDFNLLGEPMSFKSFYRIKERYIEEHSPLVKYYPVFEDRTSNRASSYKRNLIKRFKDLVHAFSSPNNLSELSRKLFYLETKALVDEMIDYEISANSLIDIIFKMGNEDLLLQDLIHYIQVASVHHKKYEAWPIAFLNYRILGFLRVEFSLKFFSIMAAIVFAAVKFKPLFFH